MVVEFPDNPDVTAVWSGPGSFSPDGYVLLIKTITEAERSTGHCRIRLSADEFMLVCEGVANDNPDVAKGLARFYGRYKMRLKRKAMKR